MRRLIGRLRRCYPEARCTLDFTNPYQLLVATVLSAQCTDERVNRVTPAFFARLPDAGALAVAPVGQVETLIRSTGFFRNKAKNLKAAAQALVAEHRGQVPASLEALVALPGIGRKTANVILGNAFDTPGITVDTHVRRLAQRLGWTREQDPVKIEFDLMALIPRRDWTSASHLLIQHGRQICHARKPRCENCPLLTDCPTGRGLRAA
ncbi:MAG: endonuclease III [Candidatus Eisenbacteria sp.]|nr:endonuclease III [Candidatus Eisenbacteria bacterium]